MNKEEKKFIERIENTFYENRGKGIKHFQKVTLYEEGITDILKLLNFVEKQQKELEQKESILDKVTEFVTKIATKNAEKYNSKNQKEVDFSEWNLALEILNIIEGEKK